MVFTILAICTIGIAYSYFLYPIILMMMPDRNCQRVEDAGVVSLPATLIITVHNEEELIRGKLEEAVVLFKEVQNLEIIVASDGSDDDTDQIVSEFDFVKLIRAEGRHGKEYAQLCAITAACSGIIVFSDVATSISANSLRRLIARFSDPEVGAVSSVDHLVNRVGQPVSEGLYIKYEMWLRGVESRKAGLIGLSGSFFAATSKVCESWDPSIPSDFNVAIEARRLGLMCVSDNGVIGTYRDTGRAADELNRKVRTVLRGMTAVWSRRKILNPVKNGIFAFQIWSHKILRWSVPWFVLIYFVTAINLATYSSVGLIALLPLVIAAISFFLGLSSTKLREYRAIGFIFYFVMANYAIILSTIFSPADKTSPWF